ncbi:MAG: aminopeptidase P family protein [Bifidobacteriaceae bacterium]|jgi:Xaa-Pro aminopeptidase|nr:aminopeptidase P family protein [Bifidobacteriaceae bacterium]
MGQENTNQSRRGLPKTPAFDKLMLSKWAKRGQFEFNHAKNPAWNQAVAARRATVYRNFHQMTSLLGTDQKFALVIPAGTPKTRANDLSYPFRPFSAFSYLTGLGQDYEPYAVLVLHDQDACTLYTPSPKDFSTPDFFRNPEFGSFWIGNRPTPADFENFCDIPSQDLSALRSSLATLPQEIVAISNIDQNLDQLLNQSGSYSLKNRSYERFLSETISEARLIKDDLEVAEIQKAIDFTKLGFENVLSHLKQILKNPHGERLAESKFHEIARTLGNWEGYDSIVGAGADATTLHWMRNSNPVPAKSLILMDAGVEVDSLYTADITRTFPVNGRFSPVQKQVYQLVLEAADAVFEVAQPGNKFSDLNQAAFAVIQRGLIDWGVLPAKPEPDRFRRWIVHGVSHHLGLDVHDCAQARAEMYYGATLLPGMCFTIEPGLYFKNEDLSIPQELRGIGVRIEDNVHLTETGNQNLSANIPRKLKDVENWVKSFLNPRRS